MPIVYQQPTRQDWFQYKAICPRLHRIPTNQWPEDCLTLQGDLNTLAEWESKWGMAFQPQECGVLSITRSRSPFKYSLRLKGHALESQDSMKYLGVDIQSSGSWKTHIDRITKKSNSMLGILQ